MKVKYKMWDFFVALTEEASDRELFTVIFGSGSEGARGECVFYIQNNEVSVSKF